MEENSQTGFLFQSISLRGRTGEAPFSWDCRCHEKQSSSQDEGSREVWTRSLLNCEEQDVRPLSDSYEEKKVGPLSVSYEPLNNLNLLEPVEMVMNPLEIVNNKNVDIFSENTSLISASHGELLSKRVEPNHKDSVQNHLSVQTTALEHPIVCLFYQIT